MDELFELLNGIGDRQIEELIGLVSETLGKELSGEQGKKSRLSPDEMYRLGKEYSSWHGLNFDYEVAVRLFHKAAGAGHAEAQFELAKAYLALPDNGDWTDRNETLTYMDKVMSGELPVNQEEIDEASIWLEKAAASGHSTSKDWLARLEEPESEEGIPEEQPPENVIVETSPPPGTRLPEQEVLDHPSPGRTPPRASGSKYADSELPDELRELKSKLMRKSPG